MILLLLALVPLLVSSGWLWTAPRVPGVREAGLVELLMSLAAEALVGGLLEEWFGWLWCPRPAFPLRRGGSARSTSAWGYRVLRQPGRASYHPDGRIVNGSAIFSEEIPA
jgi:hypothetical protein